ncbi:MAG: transglutaminase-like domain-containing protein [Candidatus Paceibacterota bacterium]
MKKIYRLIAYFFLFFLVLFTPFNVLAQEETKSFENALTSTYTVQTNGEVLVQHAFTIKNLTPTYYVNRHGLRISSPNIKSVRVSDGGGEIRAEVTQTENQTNIGITFPDQLVGEGKIRQFTITYINPDLAQIHGQVLEVAIPKQVDPSQYDQITVVLNSPLIYGEPTRVTPSSNYSVNNRNQQVSLTFNDLQGQGVSAIYGFQQVFDLKFRYFLENNDSQPVLLQVALPPDTVFQRMNYEQIEPKPESIERDKDGNWIATFYLGGNTAQIVEAAATVVLTLEPNQMVPIIQPQPFNVQAQPFWDINNRAIQELAQKYNTPQTIYDYVANNLTYVDVESLDQLKRKGAVQVLNNPENAACQEFSDLFVTLARASNIPTRLITGYAYTENSRLRPLSLVEDVLHAWPEFWNEDLKNWQPTDPTWGNTTGGVDYFNQFDLNHIVLAINGQSSSLPYPAGSYKDEQQTEKTLEVTFGTRFPNQAPELIGTIVPQRSRFSILPGFYNVIVENPTGAAWYDVSFDLSSENSQVRVFGPTDISALLPYQSVTVPIFVYNMNNAWPENDQLTMTIKVADLEVFTDHVEIENAPQFVQYIAHPYALIGLVAGSIFLALGAGSLLVFRRKR